jgi:hypothetical protein
MCAVPCMLLLCACTAQCTLETSSKLACTSWTACEGSSLAAGKYLATADRDNKVRVSNLPADPLKVGDVIPATVSTKKQLSYCRDLRLDLRVGTFVCV